MADQIERSVAALIAVLKQINTSIQRTSVYISANSPILGVDGVVQTSGASGTLGDLGILAFIASSATEDAAVSGTLEMDIELVGSVPGSLSVSGGLDTQSELISSSIAASSVGGSMDAQPGFGEASVIEIASASAELGTLDLDLELVGSVAGTSDFSDTIGLLLEVLVGDADSDSGVSTAELQDLTRMLAGKTDGGSTGADAVLWIGS
ncbi:unnamed protein product [marine sediment metagenome]|uniref:Uncharacterized protein n=1 Tax=marine sediment metagenome TaxID=412755 RepID=X0TKX1_9ZZZZ